VRGYLLKATLHVPKETGGLGGEKTLRRIVVKAGLLMTGSIGHKKLLENFINPENEREDLHWVKNLSRKGHLKKRSKKQEKENAGKRRGARPRHKIEALNTLRKRRKIGKREIKSVGQPSRPI